MAISPHVVGEPSQHWTVEDYLQIDDDRRYELLRGTLVETPTPPTVHQHFLTQFGAEAALHVRENGLGRVFDAPFDVFLADDTVVQPDLTFILESRADEILDEQGLRGAPDLVVEVLSPSTSWRDRHAKREIYADEGVEWLLFADPESRVVEVFHRQDESGKYLLETTFDPSDTFRIELFPEFAVELGEMWPPRSEGSEDADE
ncbi:MAG: Uma2 family endonuclease [Bradymonadaceae bacterium]